jgi:hypothetical protein
MSAADALFWSCLICWTAGCAYAAYRIGRWIERQP